MSLTSKCGEKYAGNQFYNERYTLTTEIELFKKNENTDLVKPS
jgi:hypothetical protein